MFFSWWLSDLLSRTAKAVGETVVRAHTLGVVPRVQLVLLYLLLQLALYALQRY